MAKLIITIGKTKTEQELPKQNAIAAALMQRGKGCAVECEVWEGDVLVYWLNHSPQKGEGEVWRM